MMIRTLLLASLFLTGCAALREPGGCRGPRGDANPQGSVLARAVADIALPAQAAATCAGARP